MLFRSEENFMRVLKKSQIPSGDDVLFEMMRVKAGVPKVGVDVTEENLPQEGRLDAALHFQKGCYLGQEIIARLHYRGHVNREIAHFVSSSQQLKVGDEIFFEDKKCGNITSVAFDSRSGRSYALGYVLRDMKKNGNKFTVSQAELEIL